MKTNIAKESEKEIFDLIEKITTTYKDTDRIDEMYVEMETGTELNKIGLVFYPKLLTYGFSKTASVIPWICVRTEVEGVGGDETNIREVLKWLVKRFTDIGYKPFHDEDAFNGYFSKEERRGYTRYSMYVNPDFPEGMWENHTL